MKTGKQRRLLRAAVVAAVVVILLIACDSRLVTRYYTVESGDIADRIRLVQLSDLHSCVYGDGQQILLKAVTAEAPDAVLLTGDMVDDKLPEAPAWLALESLAASYPCFYVTGNHEWWSGEAERICRQMEALGITVLRGESTALTVNAVTVGIFGIDDPDARQPDQLAHAAAELSEDAFSILLAHRPERIEDYLAYPFDLILSGHAHGGQWRIPGILNGLYAPNQGLFPACAGGRYDFHGTTCIVSRGLARESTPVPRIFNRPELVVIDMVPR